MRTPPKECCKANGPVKHQPGPREWLCKWKQVNGNMHEVNMNFKRHSKRRTRHVEQRQKWKWRQEAEKIMQKVEKESTIPEREQPSYKP